MRPKHRYATAAELSKEIERWLDDLPKQAFPNGFLFWGFPALGPICSTWFRIYTLGEKNSTEIWLTYVVFYSAITICGLLVGLICASVSRSIRRLGSDSFGMVSTWSRIGRVDKADLGWLS